MHHHPYFEIMYASQDSFDVYIHYENKNLPTKKVTVQQGQFIFFDAMTYHRLVIPDTRPRMIYNVELDAKSLREMNIRYGVQVIGLKNGKFKSAGIRDGFVILEINNTPMKSVSDLESMYDSIVKSNQPQKVMFITGVYPNGKMMYYAVDLAD